VIEKKSWCVVGLGGRRFRGFEEIAGRLEQFIFDELELVAVANLIPLLIGHIKNIDDLMGVGRDSRVGNIEAESM
jgi:hypothetical protein